MFWLICGLFLLFWIILALVVYRSYVLEKKYNKLQYEHCKFNEDFAAIVYAIKGLADISVKFENSLLEYAKTLKITANHSVAVGRNLEEHMQDIYTAIGVLANQLKVGVVKNANASSNFASPTKKSDKIKPD